MPRLLPLHVRCRDKRRLLAISQQALADRAEVKQSALSAFERRGGAAQALSAEKVRQVAEVLGVSLEEGELTPPLSTVRLGLFYCPSCDCPSAVVYAAGERIAHRPRFIRTEVDQAVFCPDCGEVCESRCPGCRAPVSESLRGAFCPECGSPYILSDEDLGEAELERREALRGALAGSEAVIEFRHAGRPQPGAG